MRARMKGLSGFGLQIPSSGGLPVGAGCGPGLSIVQLIMHAHHGFEEMDSQTGQGSTFRLVLPREIGYRFDVPQ